MALATSPPSCNQTSNLTGLNSCKCHKHNGWRIFDKCYSQSELLFHNAPVLNSLSRTIQSNVNGAQLSRTNVCQSCTNLADEKHFHSTCGLTFLWLSNTFVLKSFALKKKVILLQVGLQIEPCSANPYCMETYQGGIQPHKGAPELWESTEGEVIDSTELHKEFPNEAPNVIHFSIIIIIVFINIQLSSLHHYLK